jgi:hypothetical protein
VWSLASVSQEVEACHRTFCDFRGRASDDVTSRVSVLGRRSLRVGLWQAERGKVQEEIAAGSGLAIADVDKPVRCSPT